MRSNLANFIGFALIFIGFIAIVLSLVGLRLSFLAPIDSLGGGLSFLLKIVMIMTGIIILYIKRTGIEE